ncbi:MAG: alpha/beta hydrolase, partial [Deltaproteobacteria bacterium]|nr:alpha/beta hydrolase [Deltaproteobacteria bacterium]
MADPVMKQARGDGVTLQLAVWEGTKRELVCVHGLTANCRCWDRIVAALEPACRVTAMDLRGRGLSDK